MKCYYISHPGKGQKMGKELDALIERVFRSRKEIKIAIYERKQREHGVSMFTGGAGAGHCRISDPTAIQAIRNAVEIDTITLDEGFKIRHPERWLRVCEAVRDFCNSDPIDQEIFIRRYDKCDNDIPFSIEQSVYSRHLLKIRNYAKICAAQEQLIKVF